MLKINFYFKLKDDANVDFCVAALLVSKVSAQPASVKPWQKHKKATSSFLSKVIDHFDPIEW